MRYLKFATLSLLFTLSACLYEPEQFVEPETENPGETFSIRKENVPWGGRLFAINQGKQICNPSVSQDTVNYPASMLWLNFGGKLYVNPPDSVYTTSKVIQHDRLSVSDTTGAVLWYLMRDTKAGDCQFQDPEWSTHPNYIVALRAFDVDGKANCENLNYGLFAVRMSDKKKFFFYDKDMSEFATPHLWVEPGAESSAKDSTVEGFFGTKQVRLVYVSADNKIVFVDYANGGVPKTLKKASDVKDWMLESPLISPDGKFVTYNALNSSMTGWKSYVQALSDNSTPVEIEKVDKMISEPVQPHWFSSRGKLYIVWTEFPQGSQFVNKSDLFSSSVHDGSAGRTAMREVSIEGNSVSLKGSVTELAPIPLIGGRSPDGRFVASGTNNGYLLQIP